jgi:hypothetical protein
MSKEKSDIVLTLNATADIGKCGSCHFFERRGETEWDAKRGVCRLTLPPQFARVPYDAESQPENTVDDTDSCDLWRASGKTFIVSRKVGPS